MKRSGWLVLLLLSCHVSSCAHKGATGYDPTICSVGSKQVDCTRPDNTDYSFNFDDSKAHDLICVPSMDWTMIQIEMHKE